jgi:hypothetical protein
VLFTGARLRRERAPAGASKFQADGGLIKPIIQFSKIKIGQPWG